MELLRRLSLAEIITLFVAIIVLLIIMVIITANANQPVVIDYNITTATPFIDNVNVTPVFIEPPTDTP
ncbi:MAG: hypothetical protein MUE54_02965 [Anaerolineae bacterium]|jgi:hypothetical protein|nr:hypothetical protein [Anaerolineae bacterium]